MTTEEKLLFKINEIYQILISFDKRDKDDLLNKINFLAEQLNIEIPENL